MSESTAALTIRPTLIRRPRGDWLAVCPEGSCFSLGVTGATEQEAREEFRTVTERWFEIIRDTKIVADT